MEGKLIAVAYTLRIYINLLYNQGYNGRKVNCSCVYSAYIYKPSL